MNATAKVAASDNPDRDRIIGKPVVRNGETIGRVRRSDGRPGWVAAEPNGRTIWMSSRTRADAVARVVAHADR